MGLKYLILSRAKCIMFDSWLCERHPSHLTENQPPEDICGISLTCSAGHPASRRLWINTGEMMGQR